MEGNVGQLALLEDVWYQISDKRYTHANNYKGNEYLLYSKNYWIPETWIKDIKNNDDFLK